MKLHRILYRFVDYPGGANAICWHLRPLFIFMAKKKTAAIAAPDNVTFETIYFTNVYGSEPQEQTVKDWSFIPPTHCGNRPWAFVGMSYAQAKAAAVEEIGERGTFGQFVVVP